MKANSTIEQQRCQGHETHDRLLISIMEFYFEQLHLYLRNPLTLEESGTISLNRLLRNPQQNEYADKIYATKICARNPRKFY